jgi:hypothetical protein
MAFPVELARASLKTRSSISADFSIFEHNFIASCRQASQPRHRLHSALVGANPNPMQDCQFFHRSLGFVEFQNRLIG